LPLRRSVFLHGLPLRCSVFLNKLHLHRSIFLCTVQFRLLQHRSIS
jgi:hypothetical protein